MKIGLCLFFACFLVSAKGLPVVLDVSSYGAVGDGKILNTSAIQHAIDDCSAQGGGKVLIPGGNWLCGTLLLKSGVVLSLDEKATLLGSSNIEDYKVVDGFKDGLGHDMGYCFIGAVDVNHVGIEGLGTIDGQGKLVYQSGGKNRRPFLVRFVRCSDVTVNEVRLTGPTAWTMHLFRCKNVSVNRVVIRSRGLGNNDGIDIDCCEDMVVSNCSIDSGDDAICFKTTSPYPCRNVQVRNIDIFTREGAIKFGTESAGNFENITISDIRVLYAREGGIKLFSVDGSKMRNIDISNVVMQKVHLPIIVRLGARMKIFRPDDPKQEIGSINGIKIRNVQVLDGDWIGILISGIPGHYVEDLSLENISIHVTGAGTLEDAKLKPEEKIDAYPEIYMFGRKLPAFGTYIRHARNISMKNITFTVDSAEARPAIICQDLENIQFEGWKVPVTQSLGPCVNLESARNVSLNSFDLSKEPLTFLKVEGENSNEIILKDIKFINKNKSVFYGENVHKESVKFR